MAFKCLEYVVETPDSEVSWGGEIELGQELLHQQRSSTELLSLTFFDLCFGYGV